MDMGDYHPPHHPPYNDRMTASEAIASNPLAVASLTGPSPTLASSKVNKLATAPSRSPPFSCPSLDETLQKHGAVAPAQAPQFRLQMRQEPERGLAVGNDDSAFKNARVTPLDPPPICELVPERSSDVRFISVPELSVQACLVYSESPFAPVANSSKDKDPMMSGLQECGFIAPISGRHEECLFVFSELGIRTAGEYRIRFDLIDRLGSQFRRLASIYTQPFVVVADKKNFPGLSTSTELIHSLVRRGLKLRIIKSQSGKPRKRKKVAGENVNPGGIEVVSPSAQSVTPSPSSYHPQIKQVQQKQQQPQPQQPSQQKQLTDDRDPRKQPPPPLSPSKWPSHQYRQHSHPFINHPQQPDRRALPSPSYPAHRTYPAPFPSSAPYYPDEDEFHQAAWSQKRHLAPYPPDSKQRHDMTPSLSPSAGSKTSTDSVRSITSTSDEERHSRTLPGPGPQLAYLTPRSHPSHPSYSDSRDDDAAPRPYRSLPPSSNPTPHHRPSASFSRLDPPRPVDISSRSRPILPPISSISSSPPRLPNSSNR